MKKHYTTLPLLFVLLFAAQLGFSQPTGTKAPNFTLTDLNGTTHDLHTYLGQGKIVVLDFFATWCGPCIGSLPGLEDLYQAHGPNGDNTMVLLSIEMDPNTTDEAAFVTQYNVPNPVFDNGHTINNDYNIGAFPTFIVVCPNDTTFDTRVGGIGTNYHLLDPQLEVCSNTVNDAKITAGANIELDFCPGEGTITGSNVTFRNLGSADLTSLDLVTMVDGNPVNTLNWTGSLERLEYETVYLAPITGLTNNTHALEIVAQHPNAVTDENPDNNSIEGELRKGSYSSNLVTLNIQTDNWGSETTWKVQTSSGTTVAAGGPYANGPNTPLKTVNLDLDPGDCYSFTIFDQYSDGMCCSQGNGYFEMIDVNTQQTLFRGGEFKQRDIRRIDVNTVGIEAVEEVAALTMYPNPARDQVNLDFDLKSAETVTFEVVTLDGRQLLTHQAGHLSPGFQHEQITLSNLQAGIYLLHIQAGELTSVRKLVLLD